MGLSWDYSSPKAEHWSREKGRWYAKRKKISNKGIDMGFCHLLYYHGLKKRSSLKAPSTVGKAKQKNS
jgi:hypothetical protein